MLHRRNPRLFWLLGGAASGVLHLLGAYQTLGGILITYLPSLPLLFVGLMLGPSAAGLAALVAAGTALLGAGAAHTLFFLLFHALPSLAFVQRFLKPAEPPLARPVARIMADLTLAATAAFVIACIAVAGEASVESMITDPLQEAVSQMPEQYRAPLSAFIDQYAFLIPACVFWVWGLVFLGLAYLAQVTAASYGMARRRDFALARGVLPGYVLAALVAAGGLSMWDAPDASFAAKVAFVMLLFPYSLYGLHGLHRALNGMRSKPVLLAAFYGFSAVSAWPVIAVAFVEIIRQIKTFLKPTIIQS